jgi:predicted ferric reductase
LRLSFFSIPPYYLQKKKEVNLMPGKNDRRNELNTGQKTLYGWLICGVFALVVLASLSIAFVYESQTLWYKTGLDKTMLRAGQMAGLTAFPFLCIQVLIGVRVKLLDDLFATAALMRFHRLNSLFVCLLALCHANLVLIPEGITNLPIGKEFWPEMVGGTLLLVIVTMVVSSHFRQQFGFSYQAWRAVHRLLGHGVLVLAAVHVLFVSDSFRRPVPKTALLVLLAIVAGWILATKATAWRK